MNNDRRERLLVIVDALQTIRDEEQEAFDALPGSLQAGCNGQVMEAATSNLDEAISMVQTAIDGE